MDSESSVDNAYNNNEEDAVEYEEECSDYYDVSVPVLNSQSSEYSEPPPLVYSYSGISNASSTPEFTLHSSRMSEQPVYSFIFIKAEKLFGSLQKVVKDVHDVFGLEDDVILYLLYKYQWSKERLCESYSVNTEPYSKMNSMLREGKERAGEIGAGECHVCERQTSQLIGTALCQHRYCKQCWKDYINDKLANNKIFFPCMHKCELSIIFLHTFVQKLLPQLFDLYRKIVCLNYAAVNKSISYCPAYKKECDLFCERTQNNYDILVECLCGEFYCFFCRKEPHSPATCEDVGKWMKLLNDDESNSKWIQRNTKTCPSCKNPVEKYIGCAKIKCICGAQFCYECNAKWDQNHKSSKGECMSSLVRKSSLEQRTTTSDFMRLQERTMAITRTLKKHTTSLNLALECIKQQWISSKFTGIRKEITEAWLSLKWSSIVSFIYKRKNEVESSLQADFIESIERLMESVERMNGVVNLLSAKDMIGIGDQVLTRREVLRKNKDLWFQGWRSTN